MIRVETGIFLATFWLVAFSGFSQYPDFDSLVLLKVDLPAAFDLREKDRISPIRVQPTGGCWASSVMASVESFMRSSGYGNLTLSDKNLQFYHGFSEKRNTYGNNLMATAYFSRGDGPLLQSARNDTLPRGSQPLAAYIGEARSLPNDPPLIKHVILDFGAVYSMLFFRKEQVDSITHVLYAGPGRINHVITLVGWNDTLTTRKGRGVWIAQNSLGSGFGDDGFFYIPYRDTSILLYNAVWPKWSDYNPKLKIDYYDTLGSYYSYGFGDSVCYGLVKYTADTTCTLNQVGTFINHPNTRIKADVFLGFNSDANIPENIATSAPEKICTFPGYYTINLHDSVHLDKNQPYYIMMRYLTTADTMPLPVETYVKNYSEPNLASGACWVNPDFERWPDTWYECGENSKFLSLRFNLCIKAYLLK
jgi:C1A family cysteine protease